MAKKFDLTLVQALIEIYENNNAVISDTDPKHYYCLSDALGRGCLLRIPLQGFYDVRKRNETIAFKSEEIKIQDIIGSKFRIFNLRPVKKYAPLVFHDKKTGNTFMAHAGKFKLSKSDFNLDSHMEVIEWKEVEVFDE